MMNKNIIKEQEKLRIFKVRNLRKLKKIKCQYKLPLEVRIKKISEIEGFKIFLVDGYKIRQFIDYDFTMGGHGLRYVYIPLHEIWIDSSNENEKEEIILHEVSEFKLMKKGISYEKAHELASMKELNLREKKIILPVGHFRQTTPWSCGAAALKIVLDYYNDIKPIKEIIKKTKCSPLFPAEGTLHKDFENALKKWGYEFFEKNNAKIEDIENFIRKAMPVIVDYRAYHGGHFSVVIGYDKKRFLISDPAFDKKYKWIRKKEFLQKWWEEDEPGKIVKRWMLAVFR